jgi:hypothetical protein
LNENQGESTDPDLVGYRINGKKSRAAGAQNGLLGAKILVKQFWESVYKPKAGILSKSSFNSTSASSGSAEITKIAYKKWYKDRKRAQTPVDEYDRFVQSEIVCDIEDSRRWWLEETGNSAESIPEFEQDGSRYAINTSYVGRARASLFRSQNIDYRST